MSLDMVIGFLARRLVALILATAMVVAASPGGAQEEQKPQLVVIGTGTPGGVYHPLGAAICRMFHFQDRKDGLRCRSRASKGSAANIEMLRKGRLEFGIAQADLEQAAVA